MLLSLPPSSWGGFSKKKKKNLIYSKLTLPTCFEKIYIVKFCCGSKTQALRASPRASVSGFIN